MFVRKHILGLIATMSPVATFAAGEAVVTDTSSVMLNEISVTAIKQTTDLRSLASSSTTMSRGQIERNRIYTPIDASAQVPNLFMPDYGSRMTSTIYVRGLGTRIDQPDMGLNIDNIPVICKENYNLDLPDISRIEMLRGPQSTLFGRNTMGGVMNIYTLSPFNFQGIRLVAQYSSRNTAKVGGSAYHKFSPQAAIAAGIYYTTAQGSFTNSYNGKKVDWERQGMGHLKFEWHPSSDFTLHNTLLIGLSRQGGYPYESAATHEIAYNDTCFYRRKNVLEGLTLKKRFSNFSLSSITSYQYIDDNMTLDQDFTPKPYFTLTQKRREHAVTQDLVARSATSSAYNWLGGLFAFFRRYAMDAPVTFLDTGISELIESHRNAANPDYPITWDSRKFVLGSHFTSPTYGLAAYHQSSYTWRGFVATAGLRLAYESSKLKYHSSTHTGYSTWERQSGTLYRHSDIDIDDRNTLSDDFFQVLPKVSLTYNLSTPHPSRIYASVAKGYKSGGFNTQMFSDVLQQRLMGYMGIGAAYDINSIVRYKPEKTWSYEVGGHFECWESRVKSDLSFFFMDCRDRQLTVFPDGTTTGRVMTNAGKTRNWGAEFAFTIDFTANTAVNFSYGYTNAKFVRYDNGQADFSGNTVPYAPTSTLYAEGLHKFALGNRSTWLHDVTLKADVRGAGKIYWNEANTASQPFYAQLGALVALNGKNYSLEFWGHNLTDTKFRTFYFVSIGHEFYQRGLRREFGTTLRVNL